MSTKDSQQTALKKLKAAFKARRIGRRGGGRVPIQLRRQVLTLLRSGADIEAVASETGLSTKSLDRWRRCEQDAALARRQIDPPPRVFEVEHRASNAVVLHVGSLLITVEAKESA